MPQLQKVSKNNTTVIKDGDMTVVTLHSTPVVSFNAEKIILNNGGWVTVTTATRMTQAAHEYGLPFGVSRKNGKMFAHFENRVLPFRDDGTITLYLNPEPKRTTPYTGAKCGCRRGVQRDNCPNCEGTGNVVDFAAIRARNAV